MAYVAAPVPLTLVSTSVAAPSAESPAIAPWAAGSTYSIGDTVTALVPVTGGTSLVHVYESLQDSNIGNDVASVAWWLDLGPSNHHAMFDSKTGTVTEDSESIVVTVAPNNYFDTIAIVRLEGVTTVNIAVHLGETELYSVDFDTREEVTNWFDYYFGDISAIRGSLVVRPEIFYATATVTVTLTGTGTVGCGLFMIGRSSDLGQSLFGASISIEDYSTKETDDFGNTYLLERDYADSIDVEMVLDTSQARTIKRILASYRATPALYNFNNDTGDDDESLILFGKYDDFSITMEYSTKSYCSGRFISIL